MTVSPARRLAAEFIGTAFLVAAVVGSGIMADRLAGGNVALALLANSIATGAALVALILAFGPISGAHFNPAVSLADALKGGLPWTLASQYAAVQILGGLTGTVVANLMFGLPAVSVSRHVRSGGAQFLGEFVATFGLFNYWGMRAPAVHGRALRGGGLHRRRILVHVVDVFRESRRHHRKVAQ